MIDVTRLTLGEIERIESLSGQSISVLGEDDTPKGKMMAALAFVMKRRQDMAEGRPPTFTWNEALDLTMDEANAILGIETDDEEEAPEPEPAPEPNREERRAAAKKKAAEPDPTTGD